MWFLLMVFSVGDTVGNNTPISAFICVLALWGGISGFFPYVCKNHSCRTRCPLQTTLLSIWLLGRLSCSIVRYLMKVAIKADSDDCDGHANNYAVIFLLLPGTLMLICRFRGQQIRELEPTLVFWKLFYGFGLLWGLDRVLYGGVPAVVAPSCLNDPDELHKRIAQVTGGSGFLLPVILVLCLGRDRWFLLLAGWLLLAF